MPAKLRAVPTAPAEPGADERLRALFAREDALTAELARVREAQREARNLYASERGLLMRPSVEALRKVVV